MFQTKLISYLSLNLFVFLRYIFLKSQLWAKIFSWSFNYESWFLSSLRPISFFHFFFKTKIFNRDKEGHFISMKSTIYQEGLTPILSFVSMLYFSSLPSLSWISVIFSHLCSFSAPYHLSPWPFCSLVQLVTLAHVSLPETLSTELLPGRSL